MRKRKPSPNRPAAMLALYKQGQTLAEIGGRYGLTRERVRQIITAHYGKCALIGGRSARSAFRHQAILARKEEIHLAKYGCGLEQSKMLTANGAKRAFTEQRRSAKYRGIPWKMTLRQFWDVWSASGKWEQRGRNSEKFCMARLADSGGYEIGNVQIITNRENCRLYAVSKLGVPRREASKQGVCLMYPGWKKPWLAFCKSKRIGLFETEEAAYAARARALQAA